MRHEGCGQAQKWTKMWWTGRKSVRARYTPLGVFTVVYILEASSRTIWWKAFTRSTLIRVFQPFNLCVESRTVLLLRSRESPHGLRPPEDLGCKWRALWLHFLTMEVVTLFWPCWRLLLVVNEMFDAKFWVNLKLGFKISGYYLRNSMSVLFLMCLFFFKVTCQWFGHSVKNICHC